MAVTTPAPASMEVLTMRVCSIPGCGRKHCGHGYCRRHLHQFRKHGDPLIFVKARTGEPLAFLLAAIEQMAAHPSDECIEWPFGATKGYGRVRVGGRSRFVTHLVLELFEGPRPAGHDAAHTPIVCHNPRCINERHVRWATPAENLSDKLLDGTMHTKLTARDAWEIRQQWATGEWTQDQLATEFRVSASVIFNVIHGLTWRHIVGVPKPSPEDCPPSGIDHTTPRQLVAVRRRRQRAERFARRKQPLPAGHITRQHRGPLKPVEITLPASGPPTAGR